MSNSNWTKGYSVPADQDVLAPPVCLRCPVRGACGEVEMATSCRSLLWHAPHHFHPHAFTKREARARVKFDPPPPGWGELAEVPTIVVADSISQARQLPGPSALGCSPSLALATEITQCADAIAFLPGEDDQLAALWDDRGNHARRLAVAFGLVVAPALSTWWNAPPFDGLVALAATLSFAAYLGQRVPTIPTLVWRNQRDIFRTVAWLRPSRPKAICVQAGTFKRPRDWAWLVRGLDLLQATFRHQLPHPRLLIYGVSSIARMRSVVAVWGTRVTFASRKPVLVAEGGNRLTEELLELPGGDFPKSRLRIDNSLAFERAALRCVSQAAL